MNDEGHIGAPPSKKVLAAIVAAVLAGASVLAILFVLPAEFGIDPLGFGKATGLSKLAPVVAAGPGAAATFSETAYRSDVIDIPLAASGDSHHGDELEYKVRMKPGDTIVYDWRAPVENAEEFYYDFHGETPAAAPGAEPVVVEYKQATGVQSSGALTAAIPGVHGWFLQNQSVKPVTVRLNISGFYDLVAPGEYGNEMGITPRASAPAPRRAR